jgi:hypothetical protein
MIAESGAQRSWADEASFEAGTRERANLLSPPKKSPGEVAEWSFVRRRFSGGNAADSKSKTASAASAAKSTTFQ